MNAHAISQMHQELAELRKFVDLLTTEQQALLNNETDKLLELSANKSQVASLLTDFANARRKSLLENGKDTMENWMAKNAPEKLSLWQEIRTLANEAQQLNTTNGELIQSRMRSNQQALNVLFRDTSNHAGVYGPNGQANINSNGRHLGSG